MEPLHALLLAVIQGVTEFLPVSSSAHLVLLPIITTWRDQGIVIDIAAHFGSLLAVLSYFRRDLYRLTAGCFVPSRSSHDVIENRRLAWLLVWATLPILIVAIPLHAYIVEYTRNAVVIAVVSITFGLLLWLADWQGRQTRKTDHLTTADALLIGLVQVTALIPGASRSGVTMTAGLLLGLTRTEAARFSFLLSIPTILAASVYASYLAMQQDEAVEWGLIFGVTACSAAVAFLCIHGFIKFISKIGMLPFVLYRIVLGVVLLAFNWQVFL